MSQAEGRAEPGTHQVLRKHHLLRAPGNPRSERRPSAFLESSDILNPICAPDDKEHSHSFNTYLWSACRPPGEESRPGPAPTGPSAGRRGAERGARAMCNYPARECRRSEEGLTRTAPPGPPPPVSSFSSVPGSAAKEGRPVASGFLLQVPPTPRPHHSPMTQHRGHGRGPQAGPTERVLRP